MTWKIHQQFVLRPLLKMGFQEDQIQHALGRLLVNTLTIDRPQKASIMGLFPHYAMLNHSCVHNTKSIIDDPKSESDGRFAVRVIATEPISPGTEICTRYLPYNKDTFRRRKTLYEKWHFLCQCQSCSDPTECGTYYGAIACQSCVSEDADEAAIKERGYLLPHIADADNQGNGNSSDGLDSCDASSINKAKWICDKCLATHAPKECEDVLAEMEKISEKAAKTQSFEVCRNALELLRHRLHPNHCIVIALEEKMMRMTTNVDDEKGT